ncbi:unnamed protein product [Vitrella brassicaformis CCMP3155]|uniref:Peptidase M13 C-terminal domain-containing protein n=2 Tax=Vitrella brassicaformis TaxID=1169539 RepID=A0A0G4GQK4_VITBC|nr:unnamed protein product [Vitrella brassicaformis CCMP3155]|eukprot:CEM32726.1 unnamed protein product [Vitrella brassicaformis CCMP3155]
MLHCYYQACMDTDKLDSLGAAPLLNFLSKQPELGFLLLWPGEIEADEGMVRGREGEGQGLSVRMAHLHRWGVEGVLTAGVTYNNLHPSHNNTLGVAQGGLGLSYSHYFQPDILAAYTRHLATLFRLFFEALPSAHNASLPSPFSLPTQQPPAASLIDTTNDTYATIDERVRRGEDSASEVNYTRVAEGVVEFERQLHGIHLSPEQQRDPWNTTFSSNLSAIQEWMPVFDWNAYYKVFADKDDLSLSDEELAEAFTPDAEVLIQSRPHLTKLNALLHKYLSDRRKRPTLHYYFLARTLRAYGGSLSAEWRKEFHSFRKILTGSDPPPRWRTCLSATADAVGWILSRNFIRHHFNPLRKTLALEIMSGIREAFRENLAEIEWMDKDTKQKALDKESEITAKVGYPDWLLSKDEHLYFARFYGNPQPAKLKSLLSGTAHLNKQSHRFSYSKLHRPEDRSLWGMTPIDVNAYYSPDLNEIVFPASILQPPFLNVGNENSDTARRNEIRALRAVNYGALGAVIGHELTHAFDDSGSSFDGQGKLVSWWSQTSKDKFRASTHCVASQYGSFAIPGGIHLNGNLTLGENIADNGGLRLAYRALLKAEGEEALSHRPLPGLPYTAQQLFFLSFAQLWCSKQTPETLRRRVENDPHSPGEFRVKGSLDNFEPFDEAFCQAKTHAMLKGKQPHRCRVW